MRPWLLARHRGVATSISGRHRQRRLVDVLVDVSSTSSSTSSTAIRRRAPGRRVHADPTHVSRDVIRKDASMSTCRWP